MLKFWASFIGVGALALAVALWKRGDKQSSEPSVHLSNLRNRYYAIRHGQSEANVAEIISSDPEIATKTHGLTTLGFEQAASAAVQLGQLVSVGDIVILTSDFKRAHETATTVAKKLRLRDDAVLIATALRERSFGSFNGQHHSNYDRVWAADAKSSAHTENGVESVDSVVARTVKLVQECEEKYNRKTIVLVAHGDVLQILSTAFAGVEPSTHRSLPHMHNAEVRLLNPVSTSSTA